MWLKRKSNKGRSFGILRSLQQKAARRCDVKLCTLASLEIAQSGCPKAALSYLKTVCIEDKYPEGQSLLPLIQMDEKEFGKRKHTDEWKVKKVAYWAGEVARSKSDRHAAWLANVALYHASYGLKSDVPEIKFATDIEKILLRIPRKKEKKTLQDIDQSWGFKEICEKLKLTHADTCLWESFITEWKKEPKLTCRLYLYNMVANRFHLATVKMISPFQNFTPIGMNETFEIPDYAYDKHTFEGKQKGRGLEHFLTTGVKITNPSHMYETRENVRELSKKYYRAEEKAFGSKHANSRKGRQRARKKLNVFEKFKGKGVKSMKLTQTPCGTKPCSWIITLNNGTKYFVKGPVDEKKVQFQLKIDLEKEKYGLLKMDVKLWDVNGLKFLYAPAFDGRNINPHRFQSDKVLWNLAKVLIFRHAFKISDTNLRNVMEARKGFDVLSIDEMSGNGARGKKTIIEQLFTKGKVPRKEWVKEFLPLIRDRYKQFIALCKQYPTGSCKNLIEAVYADPCVRMDMGVHCDPAVILHA